MKTESKFLRFLTQISYFGQHMIKEKFSEPRRLAKCCQLTLQIRLRPVNRRQFKKCAKKIRKLQLEILNRTHQRLMFHREIMRI